MRALMRATPVLAIVLLASSLLATSAKAAVEVSFARGNYTDVNIRDRPVFGQIRAIIQQLGARYLGPGDRLSVTVLDIDLAGFDMSSRGPSQVRVLNGATSPKMRLRYRLVRNGKVVASGEDYLTDHFYLGRPGGALSSEELRHERELLDSWFRKITQRAGSPAR